MKTSAKGEAIGSLSESKTDGSAKKSCLITDFGACGDGRTLCTYAIQRAIDLCPEGGEVLIPEGCFLSGALFLKSNMTLRLAKGAKLLGSKDPKHYPLRTYRYEGREQLCYASLINTDGAPHENISIVGEGVIHAGGMKLYEAELAEGKARRGRAVCLRNTRGVTIEGVTVRQSPAWCLHLIYCTYIRIEGVCVFTKYDEDGSKCDMYNGDGIDLDSCARAVVRGCLIGSEDDCIAIKSGRDVEGRRVGIPSKDILVENCRFISGFGVAIGSEMSGGVENVTVRDCTFENTFSIVSIKPIRGRGGFVRNVTFEDCTLNNQSTEHTDCLWYRGAVYIDGFYASEEFDPRAEAPVDEGTPTVDTVTLKNLVARTVAGRGVHICGLPERPIRGLRIENVRVAGKKPPLIENVWNAVLINTDFSVF